MKIINDLGFPEAYINSITGDPEYTPDPTRIGVTSLIDSPYVRKQYLEKYTDLVVLASDYLSGFLGTCVHNRLQRYATNYRNAEKKYELRLATKNSGTKPVVKLLQQRVGDITLVGIADLDSEGIEDYKVMSAWSWVFDKEKHFTKQLNILNFLRVANGKPPAKYLRTHCFIKDWTKYQARNKDYPQKAEFSYDLKIWPLEQTEKFVIERLKLHADPNYVCTDEDRWIRTENFAIMKEGRKTAVRVFNTSDECLAHILNDEKLKKDYENGKIKIVERKSEARRCSGYCKVRCVCPMGVRDTLFEGA